MESEDHHNDDAVSLLAPSDVTSARESELLAELEAARNLAAKAQREADFLRQQNVSLAERNRTLSSRVTLLKEQRDASDYEAAELRFEQTRLMGEKLKAEGEVTLANAIHRDEVAQWQTEKKEWDTKLQQKLTDQMTELTQRATTLISGFLPMVAGGTQAAAATQAAQQHIEDGTQPGSSTARLTLGCDSKEVEAQVQALLGGYLSGQVGEEDALQQLSNLHCSLALQLAPPVAPPATATAAVAPAPASDAAAAAPTGQGSPVKAVSPAGSPSKEAFAAAPKAAPSTPSRMSSISAGGNFAMYTNFVLAEPEKLARLISRAGSSRTSSAAGAPVAALAAAASAMAAEGSAMHAPGEAGALNIGRMGSGAEDLPAAAPSTTATSWLNPLNRFLSFGGASQASSSSSSTSAAAGTSALAATASAAGAALDSSKPSSAPKPPIGAPRIAIAAAPAKDSHAGASGEAGSGSGSAAGSASNSRRNSMTGSSAGIHVGGAAPRPGSAGGASDGEAMVMLMTAQASTMLGKLAIASTPSTSARAELAPAGVEVAMGSKMDSGMMFRGLGDSGASLDPASQELVLRS